MPSSMLLLKRPAAAALLNAKIQIAPAASQNPSTRTAIATGPAVTPAAAAVQILRIPHTLVQIPPNADIGLIRLGTAGAVASVDPAGGGGAVAAASPTGHVATKAEVFTYYVHYYDQLAQRGE